MSERGRQASRALCPGGPLWSTRQETFFFLVVGVGLFLSVENEFPMTA